MRVCVAAADIVTDARARDRTWLAPPPGLHFGAPHHHRVFRLVHVILLCEARAHQFRSILTTPSPQVARPTTRPRPARRRRSCRSSHHRISRLRTSSARGSRHLITHGCPYRPSSRALGILPCIYRAHAGASSCDGTWGTRPRPGRPVAPVCNRWGRAPPSADDRRPCLRATVQRRCPASIVHNWASLRRPFSTRAQANPPTSTANRSRPS